MLDSDGSKFPEFCAVRRIVESLTLPHRFSIPVLVPLQLLLASFIVMFLGGTSWSLGTKTAKRRNSGRCVSFDVYSGFNTSKLPSFDKGLGCYPFLSSLRLYVWSGCSGSMSSRSRFFYSDSVFTAHWRANRFCVFAPTKEASETVGIGSTLFLNPRPNQLCLTRNCS